jgi:DNA-binding NarL/FixJ family response regulator
MFAAGATQGEVAAALRLSPSTVNNYLVDVYRALGVADKAALALLVSRLHPRRSVNAS